MSTIYLTHQGGKVTKEKGQFSFYRPDETELARRAGSPAFYLKNEHRDESRVSNSEQAPRTLGRSAR